MSRVSKSFISVFALALLAFVTWYAGPKDLLIKLTLVPLSIFPVLLILFFLNLLLVAFRFWRVLSHFGLTSPWLFALRASMAGNIAGLFFIPLFGQVAGRQAMLQKIGVNASINASFAAYERVAVALVSGLMGLAGGLYLLGFAEVNFFINKMNLWQVAFAAILGFSLSYFLGRGPYERALRRLLFNRKNILHITEVMFITLIAQFIILTCFVVSFHALLPHLDMVLLFAASAVVSFAASFPISAGGWGVREVAAVYILSLFGAPSSDALAASVVVGGCSTLALVGAIPFLWVGKKTSSGFNLFPSNIEISAEKAASWILPFCAIVAVFFQLHAPIAGGTLNINLADPFALLALAAVCLQSFSKRALPLWRLQDGNLILCLITFSLIIAFVVGWREIGITQWALSGRLIGWLVLLGYVCVGYLLVSSHGAHGLRRAMETLLTVACAVIAIKTVNHSVGNFEGFAGNRNAFAFQLIMVSALVIGYSTIYTQKLAASRRLLILAAFQGVVLLGIVLSGSRSGIGAAALLFLVAWFGRLANRRFICYSILSAAFLWASIEILPEILPEVVAKLFKHSTDLQSNFSTPNSDHVRWKANALAFSDWIKSPVFGIGLGVFIERSAAIFGFPVVIHSTPIWILAEFGLFGVALIGWSFYRLCRFALGHFAGMPRGRALLLVLVGFCSFSLLHEVVFQRIFWLVLGLLLTGFSSYCKK